MISSTNDIAEYRKKTVTLVERQRCMRIIEAEREWGGNLEDAYERIASGEEARVIPGWNAPSEDALTDDVRSLRDVGPVSDKDAANKILAARAEEDL